MDELFNVIVRHQVYVEGLKNGRTVELRLKLAQLEKQLREHLAHVEYDTLGDMTRTALNRLLADLKRVARSIFDIWLKELIEFLELYTAVDMDFWKFGLSLAKPDRADAIQGDAPPPEDAEKAHGAALAFPMAANGIMALAFLRAFAMVGTEKVGQAVLIAYANNETPRELLARLAGTKSANYRDGLLQQLNRQGTAVSNTVIQHMSAQIAANVQARAWPEYVWVSVLDDGTTRICRKRNGNIYRYGEGPIPPAHVGCRSSIMPFDGGPRPNVPTFGMWAKSQPVSFLRDAFDGEAPSSYEGSKALSLAEYKRKRQFILG